MGLSFNLGRLSPSLFTDSSLNVGIGAAPSGSYKLEVTGTAKVSGILSTSTFAGINGLTTPAAALTVYDQTSGSEQLRLCNSTGSGYWGIGRENNITGDLYFNSGGTLRVTFKSGGNVGIGTTSPTGKLMLYQSSAGNVLQNIVSSQGSSTQVGINLSPSMTDTEVAANPAQASIYATDSNYGANIIFANKTTGAVGNALTERGRFNSQGYFRASNNGSYISAGGTYHELMQNLNNYQSATVAHSGSSPYGLELAFTGADPNNATNWGLGFYATTPSFVWIYRIYSNGTVAGRSDARWKKNIETTRNGYLQDLCKLRVVKYNWYNHEEDAPKELGLIAQEVEEVFPNLISYDKVTTKKQVEQEDGTFIEQEFEDGESRSVKISVLPFMLLKALQEANSKIEELNERLNKAGL
jgi:hypothetical protein